MKQQIHTGDRLKHYRGYIFTYCLALCCLLVLGRAARAQETNAVITGAVADASGASVVGATIEVKNLGTSASQTVQSKSSGIYTVGQLLPGNYSITASKDGFQTTVQTGIVLTVGQEATVNLVLTVGDVKQTVTVTGAAEILNTTNAEISRVVNAASVQGLPLNGRDPSSLVLLTTGTTNVLNSAVGVIQTETTFPTSTGASAGGGRQGSTFYLLDGAPNMDTYTLLDAPFPNADATQEFRVISNSFDTRYGYSPAAIVTIQTRSGTNQFHGGAFNFLRNNDLNSANYFSHQVDTLKRNQFGGFAGGPIIKDKLFFFANYQGTRASQAAGTNQTFTPTAAMLAGDFTAVPQPTTGHCAICGTMVNPALFNPASVAIATTALPLGQDPASGSVNFGGPANQQKFDEGTGRFDYNLNSKQRLFVRSFFDYYQQIGGAVKGNIVTNAVVTSKPGKYLNDVVGHDWVINPTTVNNLTAFWTEEHVTDGGQGLDSSGNPVCLSRYITVSEPGGACYLEGLSVTNGFTTNYNEPTGENRTTYGLSDGLVKQIGNHSIDIGGNAWHQFAQENTLYPSVPIVNFSGAYTGFGLADFLFGDVNTYYQGAGEIASVKGWQLGLYAQDQYRFRPNITITAGVRWDPNTPPSSTGGRGAAFRSGQQSTVFPNAPLGLIFPGDHGLDSALQPTTYGYIQPRLGISWQPASLPHTVVRGGFGMFTSPLPYSAYNHSADIAPFSPTFQLNSAVSGVNPGTGLNNSSVNFSNPWASTPQGVSPFPPFASLNVKPPTNSTFQTPVDLPASFSPDFRLGMTESWNLSIDQQFTPNFALHMSYVASESYHLAQITDQNPGIYSLANPTGSVRGSGELANYSQILQDGSFGTSPYQSLQIAVEKRASHGLQVNSSFTWSKTIDLASTGNISFSNGLPDPFDLRHNRGNSDLNFPIISVTNYIYTTPALNGRNFIEKNLLGSWEVSGITTLQSGEPFSIQGGAGNNNSGADQYGDRADVVPGVAPAERSGGRSNWLNHYIAAGSFVENAPGTFGDSGRNIFSAPKVNSTDLSLDKNWKYQERYNLQFRWEMFNAFNHTSFGEPQTDPTSGNFGQITGIGPIAPRVQQAALKLTF
jgi:hypothetical protein